MKTFIFQCTYIHNSCIVFFIYYRFLSGGHLFIPLYSMVGRRKRFVGESSLICVWLNGLMERGKKNGNSWVCARDQSEITTTTAAFKTRDIRAPTVEIRKKQQLCSRFSFSPFIVQCRRREKRGVFNSAQRYVRQGMRLMDAIKRSHGKWLIKKNKNRERERGNRKEVTINSSSSGGDVQPPCQIFCLLLPIILTYTSQEKDIHSHSV
jgi:hypothetical protein